MSMGGGAAKGSAGYRYFFGIHMGIGRGPVDELRELRVGDKLAWQGSATTDTPLQNIDAGNLFGGDKKEGGIEGPFRLMNGEPDQLMPADLAAMIAPAPATGFRRMCTVFFDGLVAAVNPYPKAWSWRVRRAVKGWDGAVLRPDLAMIQLEGEVNSSGGTGNRETAFGITPNFVTVPLVHPTTHVFVAPAGRKITHVIQLSTQTGTDDEGPVYYQPPFTEQIIGNDVKVTLHGFQWKREFHAQCGTTLLDGSGFRLDDLVGVFEEMSNRVRAKLPIPSNGTLNFFVSGLPDVEGVPVPYEIESNGPGVAVIAFNPRLYDQDINITFAYTPSGGGAMVQATRALYEWNIGTPAEVTFVGPNSGTVASVVYVHTYDDTYVSESGGDPVPVRELPFNFIAETGKTQVLDVEVEGGRVIAGVTYYVDSSAAATLVPDTTIKAMNPAHIIFECLTNREWGRGLPRESLDLASYEAAAQVLKDEGFGLCLKWGRRDSIDSFIQSVLDTIGAALYSDRRTALLKLKLIRGDYVKSDLKLWTTANGILTISNSTVNTSTVVVNEVIVKYVDPVFNAERAVNVQNLASLQSGAFNTMTKSYSGIPIGSLARRVAQRDLKAQAEGLRRFKITMDRRGSDIVPGDVIRIEDVARNIPDMVVRVATLQDGTLTDGAISFDVVQDVFSFPAVGFTTGQPPAWSAPTFVPCIGEHEAFEVPYFLLARNMRPADFNLLDVNSAYMGTIAAQGQKANVDYLVAVKDGAPVSSEIPLPDDQLYCGYTP